MSKLATSLAIAAVLTVPVAANARPVTLVTKMNNYGGKGAYLAYYLTDAGGKYVTTLWMSGFKSKYYKHLPGWKRAGGTTAAIRGLTGASTGAGKSLSVTLDLADTLIDAGYKIHIDAAAENMRESPNDVVVPLSRSTKPKRGRRYIKSFSLKIQ
ncbi:MAG: DUF2271 domain-containing protein [Paracoccaceae bacterium]